MPDRAWFRSLYWRIALGFVAVVGLVLLLQALLFVWLTSRAAGAMPTRSPFRVAALVAADVAAALERDPRLDVQSYLREQFGHVYQPIVVVTSDGRHFANRRFTPPPRLLEMAERRLRGAQARDAQNRRRRRLGDGALITREGRIYAVVLVAPGPAPSLMVLRELGPPLAAITAALLVVGTAVVSWLIFLPARRRLRVLEEAAGSIGAGRTDVRAPEGGGDEIATLARAFNRMARDLDDRARALEESDRLRRQLLADVSHELRTPLTAIKGYVETLSMPDLRLDEQTRRRSLHVIGEETLRLERIVGDLLDLAGLEGGGTAFDRARVAVEALFERIADRHAPTLRERRLTLERSVDPGTAHVFGDAGRLEQALQNLAANAVRHTPEGGRITLRARPAAGDRVAISIRDTGPGVPPAHLAHIFDRFYKVEAGRGGEGGSGLGLSIVRAIVERHGGTVEAENAPEGGALFRIVLPAATEACHQIPCRATRTAKNP